MKILQVIRSQGYGGAESHVLHLINGLKERGHEVMLAAPEGSWVSERCNELGIAFTALRMRGLFDVMSYLQLHQLIRTWKPEITHAHQVRPSRYVGIASTGTDTIPVCTAHSTTASKHMHQCQHIIAVAGAVEQNLKNNNYPADKITRIYNGVPDIAFKEKKLIRAELGIPEDQFAVVNVGRFIHDKGQDLIVDISKRCSNDIHFYLIGDYCTSFGQNIIDSVKENDQIHFLGYRLDASVLLPAFDVYLAPSRREAFSLSLIEAASAGLPVIGSDVGGIPEMISERETGMLVSPEDVTAFAHAIEVLSTDRELCKMMSESARKKYENNFTLDKMVDQTEKLYLRLLDK